MKNQSPGRAHRTRLLTEDRARCLAVQLAATGTITDVVVHARDNAPSWYRRHYVTFRTRAGRSASGLHLSVDTQVTGTAELGKHALVIPDLTSIQPFAWYLDLRTGECLETTVFDCTCGAFRDQRHPTGYRCPHMVALADLVAQGLISLW